MRLRLREMGNYVRVNIYEQGHGSGSRYKKGTTRCFTVYESTSEEVYNLLVKAIADAEKNGQQRQRAAE